MGAAASASAVAMTSCQSIGSDVNTWRMFHNPDPMQFSGGEFHMDSSSVVEVTVSDPVFAQISRAYAMASSWSGSSSSSTMSGGFNTGSFGGNAWSMSGGKQLVLGTTSRTVIDTPVISIVDEPVMTHSAISNASAGAMASASASAGASSATANAQASSNTNPWYNFFGNNGNNFMFGG